MTQAEALKILKTGSNVFLTGEPGSGKTHVINEYAAYLREHGIEPSLTASTGIAATHLGGMTIHSWSGIGIKAKLDKHDLAMIVVNERLVRRIRRAKILIIDEISMLQPETLNSVDLVCRKIKNEILPFGGLQIVFVGDFFQLPPIMDDCRGDRQESLINEPVARFAYDSVAWQKTEPVVCYLSEQYRQDDQNFLSVLSAIRDNSFNEEHLNHLRSRKVEHSDALVHIPKLFSHNVDVDRVNDQMLGRLMTTPHFFEMSDHGPNVLVSAIKRGCLSPEKLCLKIGAEVMFTKNNLAQGFVNGTLGVVGDFDEETNYPIIRTKDNKIIKVEPMDWTIEENGKVRALITQLPLRLAWAITVHKSQGMSLDEAVMDLSAVFEYGQGYVALSRVRRLSGLHILGWNDRAFMVHPEVIIKDQNFRYGSEQALAQFSKYTEKGIQRLTDNFILACGGGLKTATPQTIKYIKDNKSTYEKTLELWQQGKNISEIAKERRLKQITILGHLEKLNQKGELKREELNRLLTPNLKINLDKILKMFRELEIDRLTPVYEKFNGKISYDDIRIARMFLVAEVK